MKQKQRFLTILPLLADAAGVAGVILLLPTLTALFVEPSTINVLIISGAFVVYCTAVYLIRKLEPAADAERLSRLPAWLAEPLTMRLLAILFSLALAVLFLQQFGYWDSIFVVFFLFCVWPRRMDWRIAVLCAGAQRFGSGDN